MPEKPQQVEGYTKDAGVLAESALLDIWRFLGDFHEHLVLVGGLVPRYLVDRSKSEFIIERPGHCGSMDVDLGVSLAVANEKTYRTIRKTLVDKLGFKPGANEAGREQRHSFVKEIEGNDVILDFLTVKYGGPPAKIREIEESLSAIQAEGLGLALRDPLIVEITGPLLSGDLTTEQVRICRAVPYVVLKALAFDNRGEPKDSYDLVYTLRYYQDGPSSVASEVRDNERGAESFQHALTILAKRFKSLEYDGPGTYANFLGGNKSSDREQAFAAVQEFLREVNIA